MVTKKRNLFFLPLLLLIVLFSQAQGQPDRWESAMQEFEIHDKNNPPPEGAVLFAGSSSIRMWDSLQEDFPFVKVINRGFGGSHMEDLLYYTDRIVIPYKPSMIFVYEGDNDINAGKTPETVLQDFQLFVNEVTEHLPDTKIGFLAIKPSTARWDKIDAIRKANQLVRDYTLWQPNLEYIDTFTPMLGIEGTPREELLLEDGLHMTDAGYEIWTKITMPFIKAASKLDSLNSSERDIK